MPDTELAVIGDVHGRADLLSLALMRIEDAKIICVGDYIDRGPDSALVLEMLMQRPDVICLGGNHETMFLSFLDDPERHGQIWLRHGGTATLGSFGVEYDERIDHTELRDEIANVMGASLIDWLRARPSLWQSGNVAVVHAAANPSQPIDKQIEEDLRWGHRNFTRRRRRDDVWVVHGHTLVPQPKMADGRIAIDTGAYATGRLCVARISAAQVTFEQVEIDD